MAGGRKREAEASPQTTGNLPGQPAAAPERGSCRMESLDLEDLSLLPIVCWARKKPVYDISWQTPACAKAALKHYNKFNEDEHELVKALDSIAFFYNGQWMHANFLAKSKGGTSCADLVPKYFFAELKVGPIGKKMSCVSCIKMDRGNPRTAPVHGCRICPSRIFHPAAGGHIGSGGRRVAASGVETKAASLFNADSTAQIKSVPVEQPPAGRSSS